mmetsp:Transcript_110901/g.312633  ORF Transcript_110901/g.312633 Transcript_110901/m.312633 type:complete len:292 (+) Transcript_110901:273-1148(+)
MTYERPDTLEWDTNAFLSCRTDLWLRCIVRRKCVASSTPSGSASAQSPWTKRTRAPAAASSAPDCRNLSARSSARACLEGLNSTPHAVPTSVSAAAVATSFPKPLPTSTNPCSGPRLAANKSRATKAWSSSPYVGEQFLGKNKDWYSASRNSHGSSQGALSRSNASCKRASLADAAAPSAGSSTKFGSNGSAGPTRGGLPATSATAALRAVAVALRTRKCRRLTASITARAAGDRRNTSWQPTCRRLTEVTVATAAVDRTVGVTTRGAAHVRQTRSASMLVGPGVERSVLP